MDEKVKRIWELDFIRGLAILGMIFIHLNYTLLNFYSINIFSDSPGLDGIVDIVMDYGGIIFILISGICSCFSENNLKRGLNLFFVSMVLTYATLIIQEYLLSGSKTIITFGILHCLSILMIAGHFLLKIPPKKHFANFIYLFSGVIIIITGYILKINDLNFPVLFGHPVRNVIESADYFPLIPYSGWFILGIFIGKTFYQKGYSIFKSQKSGNFFIIRGISFIGRNSLIFYLLHQPVIFAILFVTI